MRTRWMRTGLRLAAAAAAVTLAACSDSTAPQHHAEAEGMVVVDHATDEVLVTVDAARRVTGALSVPAGEEIVIGVFFVDADGDRFQPDGDEHTLAFSVADGTVASLGTHEDHMHLEGLRAGATTAEFSIRHGSHDDYRSPPVPVTVTP